MKIAVLGTGMVGFSLAEKLLDLGYDVKIGSRSATNQKVVNWANANGSSAGTFAEAAAFGDLIFLAIKGEAVLEAIHLANPENFKNKIVVDVTNPLDFSHGFPPSLLISNNNSLGEEVQKALPDAQVVKTLNTVNAGIMVVPGKLSQETDIFLSGNSAEAKTKVRELLNEFGWGSIIDLGGITTARATEQLLPLWASLYQVFGNANFNFKIVRD